MLSYINFSYQSVIRLDFITLCLKIIYLDHSNCLREYVPKVMKGI